MALNRRWDVAPDGLKPSKARSPPLSGWLRDWRHQTSVACGFEHDVHGLAGLELEVPPLCHETGDSEPAVTTGTKLPSEAVRAGEVFNMLKTNQFSRSAGS